MANQMELFAGQSCDTVDKSSFYIDETPTWESVKTLLGHFPAEDVELLPGIRWGSHTQLYTPAFWKLQYLISDFPDGEHSHRLSHTITEEVIMCILGGYGIPSEMGIIAFQRLKENGLIKEGVQFEKLYEALSSPFPTSTGKGVTYRFYNQKSKYIHSFLCRKDFGEIPVTNDIALREWLLTVDGIGLKTASWITRNWLKSDNVAILDVHLLRAGSLAGFFETYIPPSFDYLKLEKKYLEFCNALQVQASNMDAVIWYFMKKNTRLATRVLNYRHI